MHRLAVGIFEIAYAGRAGKSASIELEAQYQDRKTCLAEPDIGICTKAVPVDRKAYKALIELQARRCQRATRSRSNIKNKFSDIVVSICANAL
jgi:hypothetical protein